MNRRMRLTGWLAIVAMALHALWPLVAQAKPRSVTLVPVCTVNGVTHYLELAGGGTPLEKQSSDHLDHCAFCSFESGRTVALPSNATDARPNLEVADAAIEYVVAPQNHPLQHPPAHPRAPPAVS